MTAKVFEAALGIADPWSVASVDFPRVTHGAEPDGGVVARTRPQTT